MQQLLWLLLCSLYVEGLLYKGLVNARFSIYNLKFKSSKFSNFDIWHHIVIIVGGPFIAGANQNKASDMDNYTKVVNKRLQDVTWFYYVLSHV